ncbi:MULTISPECIES: GTPase HflX [unclassified Saccharibacter]|uniref:GTPase HflX n=1 Tax=unclassified Saccharibacter TaxID=2648722 RepID=UPI00132997A4|nr:GTPase HflX [Saccharibacter sp. EH611]MXV58778.1 GTPase HflX [Saccharibacter sp. EH70]MXV65610.1 GTPase HflX [Saccharibacter sp. EH60]
MRRQPKETARVPTVAAVVLPVEKTGAYSNPRAAQSRLEEAVGLAASIGLEIAYTTIFPLRSRRPATLLGAGQLEQLCDEVKAQNIGVVVVDSRLSPVQQRNLEKELGCKVVDRTGLILDIFGARAATREGVLQVELAHLEYQRSRLVRLWTHLERQRGGFGFMGGPGETQMEADRRMLDERLVKLRKELEQVRRTRGLHRSARRRVPFPIVALVGYTNAGKSTLFNTITGAEVHAQDQLFATLDPTMRGLTLPSGRHVILSDTVGFISDLPTELIAAFRATLEEVAEADIILHVRDAAHPESNAQRDDVLSVLDDMAKDGMLDSHWPERVIEVMNKADLLGGTAAIPKREGAVVVSALTKEGLPDLLEALDQFMTRSMEIVRTSLAVTDGAAMAWLYDHGEVIERADSDEAITLTVRLTPVNRERFKRAYPTFSLEDVANATD